MVSGAGVVVLVSGTGVVTEGTIGIYVAVVWPCTPAGMLGLVVATMVVVTVSLLRTRSARGTDLRGARLTASPPSTVMAACPLHVNTCARVAHVTITTSRTTAAAALRTRPCRGACIADGARCRGSRQRVSPPCRSRAASSHSRLNRSTRDANTAPFPLQFLAVDFAHTLRGAQSSMAIT